MSVRPKVEGALFLALSDPLFYSVQGEGASLGRPSVFVRVAGCTVGCLWCDTKYSWPAASEPRASPEEVVAFCRERRCGNVVLTGGEPLESPGLLPFAEHLAATGLRMEVETSGYLAPEEGLLRAIEQWNVSPKLSSAAIPEEKKPRTLLWLGRAREGYLKFVISRPEEVEEIPPLLERCGVGDFPPSRIFLMPEALTARELERKSAWLVPLCLERGYRFSTRLHVLLWGAKRGV